MVLYRFNGDEAELNAESRVAWDRRIDSEQGGTNIVRFA